MATQVATRKRLIWEVYTAVNQRLAAHGFEQVRAGSYRLVVSHDVAGWITLGTVDNVSDADVGVFPQVSLIFGSIEKLRAAIDGREVSPDQHTLGGPLHLIMDRPTKDNTWKFSRGADNSASLRDLIIAIEDHALPYLKSFRDVHALREVLDEKVRRRQPLPNMSYVLPMTLYVIGDIPGTLRVLDQLLDAAQRSGSVVYARTYTDFVQKFRRFIDQQQRLVVC